MPEKTILLVEDNADDEALTLRALKVHHIANPVVVARDGAQAVEYLLGKDDKGQAAHELPVAILLDIRLPKMDGLEVLQRLRANERTRYIPVIVLTSSSQDQDLVDSYRFGANSYVRKPVDFDQFADAVGKLGIYWLLLNQAPGR